MPLIDYRCVHWRYVCACVCVCLCMRACGHVCVRLCVYVCARVCACVCVLQCNQFVYLFFRILNHHFGSTQLSPSILLIDFTVAFTYNALVFKISFLSFLFFSPPPPSRPFPPRSPLPPPIWSDCGTAPLGRREAEK